MTLTQRLFYGLTVPALMIVAATAARAATYNEVNAPRFFNGGAGPEAVGPGIDRIQGSINGGDNGDLYKLVFDTGGTLVILARGLSGQLDPALFLFDATGAGIRADDNSGPLLDSRIEVAIVPGVYYIGLGDDPMVAVDTDGTVWTADDAIDAVPPADFGILDHIENTSPTIINPGNYAITLSIATAGVAVPEPGTLGLLAAGLAGLGLVARRRR